MGRILVSSDSMHHIATVFAKITKDEFPDYPVTIEPWLPEDMKCRYDEFRELKYARSNSTSQKWAEIVENADNLAIRVTTILWGKPFVGTDIICISAVLDYISTKRENLQTKYLVRTFEKDIRDYSKYTDYCDRIEGQVDKWTT